MNKICVIGGGAAGCMAAYAAAKNGAEVVLFEGNEKIGKKIYITGKGRCNITNAVPVEEFMQSIINNSKFMYSALNNLDSYALMDLFEANGLRLKVERGDRAFPESDKSSDVIKTLEKMLRGAGVRIMLSSKVSAIDCLENGNFILRPFNEEFDKVIIATGGLSYPATGSTGDGYNFLQKFGHTTIKPVASLVPILLKQNVAELQGLSLLNVALNAFENGKRIHSSEIGEMLFTDKGITGPLVLSLSALINRKNLNNIEVGIDFKPALSLEQLDARILRDFQEISNKNFKNSLDKLMPRSLIPYMIARSAINPDKPIHQITAAERQRLVGLLKDLRFSVAALGELKHAVVTSGGINVKEVDAKTMQSKLARGIYICGELLDVDALTGGFNLQIAFATGFAAGNNAALALK